MPAWSRLASCCVNVASSCSFGLRCCSTYARSVGGRNDRMSNALAGALGVGGRRALARVHGNGEQAEALDLRHGRRTVGHFQNALDHFAGAAARLVRKLRHDYLYLKPLEAESCKLKSSPPSSRSS